MPPDDLQDLDEPNEARRFIQEAFTPHTAEINRTQIKSQIYLAHKTKVAGESLAAAVSSLAEALERAFNNHAQALREAATASDTHARGLNRATWALVGATVLLALATGALVYLTYKGIK